MSKDYISLEHAIRNIMNGKRQAVNEQKQLDEFKMPTKLPEIPDIRVNPELPDVKPKETLDGKTKVDTETTGKVDIDAKTKTPETETPNVKDSGKKKTDTPDAKTTRLRIPSIFIPSFSSSPLAMATPGQGIGADTFLHMARSRQAPLGPLGEEIKRTEIENVARPKTDRNKVMARNQSIKKQIIDETSRRKETIKKVLNSNTNINLKPETNDEPNEVNESWGKLAAGLGLGALVGASGSKAEAEKKVDKPDKSEKKDFMGLSNKEYGGVDAALDLTSMVPFIGTPAALASAARSYQRGDYVDTALDLASAIPGIGTIIKGVKAAKNYGRIAKMTGRPQLDRLASRINPAAPSGSKRQQIGSRIHNFGSGASNVATGAELGDMGYKVSTEAGRIRSGVEDLKKSGDWENVSPEDQKKWERLSTTSGILGTVGKQYASDINKDVIRPIKKMTGIGEEYISEGKPGVPGVKLDPVLQLKLDAGSTKYTQAELKQLRDAGIEPPSAPKDISNEPVSPAEVNAARTQPEGGASNIDPNGSKKTDKPEAGLDGGNVDTTGKPAGASVGRWSPTQKRKLAAGLRPGAGALGAGAVAAGLVGLGLMGNDDNQNASADDIDSTSRPDTEAPTIGLDKIPIPTRRPDPKAPTIDSDKIPIPTRRPEPEAKAPSGISDLAWKRAKADTERNRGDAGYAAGEAKRAAAIQRAMDKASKSKQEFEGKGSKAFDNSLSDVIKNMSKKTADKIKLGVLSRQQSDNIPIPTRNPEKVLDNPTTNPLGTAFTNPYEKFIKKMQNDPDVKNYGLTITDK